MVAAAHTVALRRIAAPNSLSAVYSVAVPVSVSSSSLIYRALKDADTEDAKADARRRAAADAREVLERGADEGQKTAARELLDRGETPTTEDQT